MQIGIEALGIHYFGGGRSATVHLLKTLFALDQDNDYILVLNQPEPELEADNVRQTIIPAKNRFSARILAQLVLPWLTRNCDLVHFVKDLGVFGVRSRTVVTIYDLATLLYPEFYPTIDVWYWKSIQKQTLRRVRRVIAISNQTARDIRELYKVPADKISVIYPSCGRHIKPASEHQLAQARQMYDLPEAYILHVGRIDPKKNITVLIDAFTQFSQRNDFQGKLVLVGEPYKKRPDHTVYQRIEQLGLGGAVHLVGAVPDEHLAAFYTGSSMVVLPSIYEGFGITALEAMTAGAPLIVNRAGAVVEVVGDAALIMPQNTADALADLMTSLWKDDEWRQALAARGLQRASMFSASRSARQTLQLYDEMAQGK